MQHSRLISQYCSNTYRPLQAQHISVYPPVHQDFAFTVHKGITSQQLETAIRDASGEYWVSVELFDVYSGGQVGADEIACLLEVTFRAFTP